MTITEALAEIKTISKRINSKRDFISTYLHRLESTKDPLEKDGGSYHAIQRERQAIRDLENRIVELRRNIQLANEKNEITVEGVTRTIADWLVWRREVAPIHGQFLYTLKTHLRNVRDAARRQGSSVVIMGVSQAEKPSDIVVNVNEQEIATESETHEKILGELDGQLSLKNATVMI